MVTSRRSTKLNGGILLSRWYISFSIKIEIGVREKHLTSRMRGVDISVT